jgi:hypothetical protein
MPIAGWLIALALACAALFVALLHPLTGMLGGALYWLIGSALPTLSVTLLAAGVAWLLPVGTIWRILAALIVSIPLGLNTALIDLRDVLAYRPVVSSDIRQRIVWRDDEAKYGIAIKAQRWGAFAAYPVGAPIDVGGDEGCGCMYFVDRKNFLYGDLVTERLFAIVGRRGAMPDYASLQDPSEEVHDVHIALSFWKQNDNYRALVEMFDHGKKIAAFAHTNIPARSLGDPIGVGRERMLDHFWSNATELLLHANLWTTAFNAVAPGIFPEQQFRDFIVGVLPQPPKP